MAYRLTDRILHPSSVERVNVQLAASATHETTVAALRFYGQQPEHDGFMQTAEFLHIIRSWFNIVNVKLKSPLAHIRRKEPTLTPISKDNVDGLAYIEKFGEMMTVTARPTAAEATVAARPTSAEVAALQLRR